VKINFSKALDFNSKKGPFLFNSYRQKGYSFPILKMLSLNKSRERWPLSSDWTFQGYESLASNKNQCAFNENQRAFFFSSSLQVYIQRYILKRLHAKIPLTVDVKFVHTFAWVFWWQTRL